MFFKLGFIKLFIILGGKQHLDNKLPYNFDVVCSVLYT